MNKKEIHINKVTTKTGDKGKSLKADGLMAGKNEPWFDLVGSLDELNSSLGISIHYLHKTDISYLQNIQSHIFDIGSFLYKPSELKDKEIRVYLAEMEEKIETLNKSLPPLKSFILPTGTSSYLHLSRSICRRAERIFWTCLSDVTFSEQKYHDEIESSAIPQYLNRLSDLLFILARIEADIEIEWK